MPKPLPETAANHAADVAACRALLRTGSRTFFAASLFLPSSIRDSATVLYAFCRLADDAVDGEGDGAEGLKHMRERLDQIYSGQPVSLATDRALAEVVRRFGIPRELPEALLEGCEWDVLGREYDDLESVEAYAARVAGAVGAMMAVLMGVRAPELLARACDLGVAMQLSNIARDVGEDAQRGRLYLPRQWMVEAGIDPDLWLQNPVHSPQLGSVIQRLLHAADKLYQRVDAGINALPPSCRPGIHAASRLYAEIGREVERIGLDSVSSRAVVSGRRKLAVLLHAAFAHSRAESQLVAPALDAVRFLIEAVALQPLPQAVSLGREVSGVPWWQVGERVGWVFELFIRLEQHDHVHRVAPRHQRFQPPTNGPELPTAPWWNLDRRWGWVMELFSHMEQREQARRLETRA
jgi:phytoene synthase